MTTVHSAPYASPVHRPLSKGLNIACWALQVLAALGFLMAGGSKLASAPAMVEMFAKVGAGQWFRYLTGALEVIGAVALLIPRATFYGAALLSTVMVGAIVTHLVIVGGSPIPALILLMIVGAVGWFRRPRAS